MKEGLHSTIYTQKKNARNFYFLTENFTKQKDAANFNMKLRASENKHIIRTLRKKKNTTLVYDQAVLESNS